MKCNAIRFKDFKGFEDETVPLSPITVLVGGNNAGKSSVLQGIHFGTSVLQASKIADARNFSTTDLRYCPTDDFLELKRSGRLTEGSGLEIEYIHDDGDVRRFCKVTVRRGRNGAVSIQVRNSDADSEDSLSDLENPYSIYVPGLSGVPLREEYKSELVVDNGIARGDANLYLRNILYRISRSEELNEKFHVLLNLVFDGLSVHTKFDEKKHLNIQSRAKRGEGDGKPIDMLGTGALQAIQLIAYVVKYNPSMLLLDEPDAHLHPSNQRTLCKALKELSENTDVQIVVATHSRHFVDEFINYPNSNVVWLKDSQVQRERTKSQIAILTDIGAMDDGERVLHRDCRALVWTEDSEGKKNQRFLKTLLEANGFREDEYAILSYVTSNKIESALMLARFVSEAHENLHIVIHRDRDFMTDHEVEAWRNLYQSKGVLQGNVELFFTRGSDIEAYFCEEAHLRNILGEAADASDMLGQIVHQHPVEITSNFTRKRDQIKASVIYSGRQNECPHLRDLIDDQNLDVSHCIGKWLRKRINERVDHIVGIQSADILRVTPALREGQLHAIAQRIWAEDI